MMQNRNPEMPFLKNIGFNMTYKCQVMCTHCVSEAGPDRIEDMKLVDSLTWIQQIAQYRNSHVKIITFTGGEPFFNINKLRILSDYAASLGLIVATETNAFWAKSEAEAKQVLKSIRSVRMLTISSDVYHQQSIPFKNVANAVAAAKECKIPFNIQICTNNEEDEKYKSILGEALVLTGHERITTISTIPAGRASGGKGVEHQSTYEPSIKACSAGSSPIILPDGRVILCLGLIDSKQFQHPFLLGNLNNNSLEEILDQAEVNPVIHCLRIWGPGKIIAILEEHGLNKYLPEDYTDNICKACYQAMQSEEILNFINEFMHSTDFIEKIAYARMYYLGENRMIEILNNNINVFMVKKVL